MLHCEAETPRNTQNTSAMYVSHAHTHTMIDCEAVQASKAAKYQQPPIQPAALAPHETLYRPINTRRDAR